MWDVMKKWVNFDDLMIKGKLKCRDFNEENNCLIALKENNFL